MATLEGLSPLDQLRHFWRWWTAELAACIPSGLRDGIRRLSVLPMVVPEGGGFGIYRYDGKAWKRIATAQGTGPELAKALAVQLRAARIDRFAVGMPPGQYLAKTLAIPQAAEENLRNAILYDLDRHTPFKADDVGFDCAVVGRNDATRELLVRLVIAPRTAIGNAVAAAAASGMTVAAVQPALPDRDSLGIDLLPHDEATSRVVQRLVRWVPWVFLLALGGIAIALPIAQKRAQVIELQPQVNVAGQQAAAADALHQQLDKAQNEYNFVLLKRYAMPTSLQLLNEVTRILPDDTWLQSFELRTTQKGRELQLQGETGVAGKMIELFEQSPLVAGATFKSPVTQAPGSTASRFHIGMDVKEIAPPAARVLKPDGTPDTAAAIAGGPGAPKPPATGTPAPGSAAPSPSPAPGAPAPAAVAGASGKTSPSPAPAAPPGGSAPVPAALSTTPAVGSPIPNSVPVPAPPSSTAPASKSPPPGSPAPGAASATSPASSNAGGKGAAGSPPPQPVPPPRPGSIPNAVK